MAKLEKLLGEVLDGKYHLDRLLGQGGMGAVFLATHLGTTRPVAVKVIAPQLMTNEEVGERFRREAEAAGRLRHPNVVNVTDFGVAEVGRDRLAYLVMEYLDGCSLGEMLKQRGALPLPFVVDIVEQICLAIANAHQQGIIHRDLKPDNIYLQPDRRGSYIVKVLDFGLAKLHDASLFDEAATNGVASPTTRTLANQNADTIAPAAAALVTQPPRRALAEDAEDAADAATLLQTPATKSATTLHEAAPEAEAEAVTRIQPLPQTPASPGEEAATRIFTESPLAEEATRIFAEEAQASVPAEEATRIFIDPDNPEADEAATRIQTARTTGITNRPVGGREDNSDGQQTRQTSASASRNPHSTSAPLTNAAASRSASLSGGGVTASVELTRLGSILGTPLYMSPEQCRGEALDPRSDIYSLGVIVYQMLAGEPPFRGGMTELMSKHCDETPPSLKEKQAAIPAAVANLVTATLAKNPEARPATAENFATALRATAETEEGLLRQAKTYYYTAQRAFFQLSLGVYAVFALLTIGFSLAFNAWLSRSVAFAMAFYLAMLPLIFFAVRMNLAGSTLLVNELRQSPPAAVRIKPIFKALLAQAREQFAASLRVLGAIFLAPLRGRSPARVYVDGSLVASTIAMEGARGGAAMRRSQQLVAPVRVLVKALAARDVGISLISIVGFPSVTMIMAAIFGANLADMLSLTMMKTIRTFTVGYVWFILIVMHTVYSASAMALVYFKARQANGETLSEQVTDAWRQGDAQKQSDKLGKATIGWFVAPFVLLAGLLVISLLGIRSIGSESLADAVQEGRQATVKRLLAAGKNPNETRIGNRSLLMQAARDGQREILEALLAAGATVEQKDGFGDTALTIAAANNRSEAIRVLLSYGADINVINNKGQTALMLAASRGRFEAVALLLSGGATPTGKDHAGKTALQYAVEESHANVIQLLKEAGVTE